MSICESICGLVTECLKNTAMFLYKQPVVKNAVMNTMIMYDNYCESQETVELTAGAEPELDLDDLLAELEGDEDLKFD